MNQHLTFKIPLLPRPVPFCIGPSKHNGDLVAYINRDVQDHKRSGCMLIAFAVLMTPVFIYLVIELGLFSIARSGRYATPVIAFPFVIGLLVWAGLHYFKRGMKDRQVLIDMRTGFVQFHANDNTGTAPAQGAICVWTASLVFETPTYGGRLKKRSEGIDVYLVSVHTEHDYECFGAFKSSHAANEYAAQLADHTNLPIEPAPEDIPKEVSARKELLRSDATAQANPIHARALEPIAFRPHE